MNVFRPIMTVSRSYERLQEENILEEESNRKFYEFIYFSVKTGLAAGIFFYVYNSPIFPFLIGFLTGSLSTVIIGFYSVTSLSMDVWKIFFQKVRTVSKLNIAKLILDILTFQQKVDNVISKEITEKPCLDNLFVDKSLSEKESIKSFSNQNCNHCKFEIPNEQYGLVDMCTGHIYHEGCSKERDHPPGTILFQSESRNREYLPLCDHCKLPMTEGGIFHIDRFTLHTGCIAGWNASVRSKC